MKIIFIVYMIMMMRNVHIFGFYSVHIKINHIISSVLSYYLLLSAIFIILQYYHVHILGQTWENDVRGLNDHDDDEKLVFDFLKCQSYC